MQPSPRSAPAAATINQLIEQVTVALAAAGVGTPRLDAELLLAAASGTDRTTLYARGPDMATSQWRGALDAMLARRLAREPLQYIVGTQEFWSLDFIVTPDVLIPRPETELLVELTLRTLGTGSVDKRGTALRDGPRRRGLLSASGKSPREIKPISVRPEEPPAFGGVSEGVLGRESKVPAVEGRPVSLCDMGTGSGCIAVALARELPQAEIWAVDASPAALAVAEANARCHGVAQRIHCVGSDLFESLTGRRFHVIVSNPPYVPAAQMASLQPEVRWEPRRALYGGAAGLDIIARLLAAAPAHLIAGGSVIMEIGADQEAAVRTLAATHFKDVSMCRDYAGQPRVLIARG